MLSHRLFQWILAAIIILIAAWLLMHGLKVGKDRAQANRIIADANSVRRALDYFYADQGRYPTTLEFMKNESFGIYLAPFPPTSFVSSLCPQSMKYDQSEARSFRFYICIPAATQAYAAGWNLFASKP